MFHATAEENGVLVLSGRLDAAQVEKARATFSKITTSTVLDFSALDYISSLGLGILMATQKRLMEQGHSLKIRHPNGHIRDVFRYAGFDRIFEIIPE